MKIGIDIDNVLADLTKGFCDFYNKKYNKEIVPEDFEGYYLRTFLPIKREEEFPLWMEYYNSEDFAEMPLLEKSREIINSIKNKNNIIFITARNLAWKDKTENFIKRHFPEDNFEIIYSGDIYGKERLKHDICKELGINLLIEDHGEKSVGYAESGIKVILITQPWNRNIEHKNIIRVNNWDEILKEITKFEGEKI